MKNLEKGSFKVGQKLLHCPPGTKIETVTFVSLGPRRGKSTGHGSSETVLTPPETAIVRDRHNNLQTVRLADLQPLPSN